MTSPMLATSTSRMWRMASCKARRRPPSPCPRRSGPSRGGYAPVAFSMVDRFCMALSCGARRALNGPFRLFSARAGCHRGGADRGAERDHAVRALPGWLSALRIFHSKSSFHGAFVGARRALNGPKRRFPARAAIVWTARSARSTCRPRKATSRSGVGLNISRL